MKIKRRKQEQRLKCAKTTRRRQQRARKQPSTMRRFPPTRETTTNVGEKRRREEDGGLTESKLTRAKMAKVETLSHTHLVRNEWTGTALQLRADQDPSREELHKEGGRGKDNDALGEERRGGI